MQKKIFNIEGNIGAHALGPSEMVLDVHDKIGTCPFCRQTVYRFHGSGTNSENGEVAHLGCIVTSGGLKAWNKRTRTGMDMIEGVP